MNEYKRVLVTGGAGFIGSNLCRRLLDDGCEVLCVDSYLTGRRKNILPLLGHPRFDVIRHDVTAPLSVEVDEIYNLACPASPAQYQRAPIQTFKTSVLGAINMLGLARRLKAPILQASTSEVYGDPCVHPQPETYNGNVSTVGPRACYDEGKRAAETLFFDYRRQHDLPIKVARIFNTYGPRMLLRDGRVVSNFITQALLGEPLTIYGDGLQTRSFCYVDDLLEGLIRLMGSSHRVAGPMNLGCPFEVTVQDLAERILKLTRSKSKLHFQPLPVDDPVKRRPDITQARSVLGWEPRIGLTEGLERTIDDFRQRLSTPSGGRAATLVLLPAGAVQAPLSGREKVG